MTTVRPDLVNLPSLEIPTEGTTLFVVQDSAVNQTLTVQKARYLLATAGPTGGTGPTGWTGPTGASGYSGYSGASGYSGYSGASGYSGYSGTSGYSGYSGISGYSGYSGISGYSGYSGISGYSGVSGYSGYSGATGPTGPTGPTDAINILGGNVGSIPIQQATSQTSFISLGSPGNLLQVKDTTTATWVSTTTLMVGFADKANKLYSNAYTETEISPVKYISMTQGSNNHFDFGITNSLFYHTNNKKLTVPTLEVTTTTNATNSTTGALVVSGGVGIGKDLWVGGEIFANKLTIEYTTITQISITTDDVTTISNQTNATSTTTGALVVLGGVGIGKDLWVGEYIYGNLVGVVTTASNLADGTAGQVPYQVSPGVTDFTGPGNVNDILVSNGTTGPVFQNTLTLTSTLASNSTNTGALRVYGGTGIGGSLNVGQDSAFNKNLTVSGDLYVNGGDFISTATAFNLLQSDVAQLNFANAATGIVMGSTSGWTQIRTLVTLTNTLDAADINSGALVVKGGVGISKDLWVGGVIHASIDGSVTTATNLAGGLTGSIPIQSNPGKTSFIPIGGNKTLLESNGSTATWVSTTTIYVNAAVYSNNLFGGAQGSIPVQNNINDTTFLSIGTNGFILTSNGTTPVWLSPGNLTAGNATTATNLANGTAGQVPYQTSPGVTSFYGPGTLGEIVVSGGTVGPRYQNTLTLAGTTPALSTSSGALQVRGGVGIGGDLYVGGDVYVLGQANYIINQANYATTATNLAGGLAGSIPYQTAPGLTTFVNIGTNGFILGSNGTSPVWISTASLIAANANNANLTNDLKGGTTGQIVYQRATDDTDFAGPGNAGDLLVSRGADANGPVFQNTATIRTLTVGTAWRGGADGEIRAENEITAYWGSDVRFKENIKPIESALNLVNQIRGVRFDWKEEYLNKRGGEDGYFVRKNDVGVIAQEIESILPEIVGTRNDGMKVVKYERLTALLIEAVKELSQQIQDLKSKIAKE